MNIDEIAKIYNLKKYKKFKPYYTKYQYKLTAFFPKELEPSRELFDNGKGFIYVDGILMTPSTIEDMREKRDSLREKQWAYIDDIIGDRPVNFRKNNDHVSFFCETEDEAIDFIREKGKYFTEYYVVPKEVNKLLEDESDIDVDCRASLYRGEYLYRVNFMANKQALIDPIIKNSLVDDHFLYEGKRYTGPSRILYLNDINELFVIKLALGEYIIEMSKALIYQQ